MNLIPYFFGHHGNLWNLSVPPFHHFPRRPGAQVKTMMEGYIAAVEAAKVWGCEGPPWYQLILKMAIEIMDLPIKNCDFP